MIFDLFYNQFTLLAQPSLPTLSAKYPRVSVRDFSFLAPFPTVFRGGLNRSTQHFILEGKDGVYGYGSKISSRFHGGRENGVMGPLAAWRVFEGDWASVW